MGHDAIKPELIEWLTQLSDGETLNFLKIVKDSRSDQRNWWSDLTDAQKKSIEKGLSDIDSGKATPHDEVANKYGLCL